VTAVGLRHADPTGALAGGIRFRIWDPSASEEQLRWLRRAQARAGWLAIAFEVYNTRLPGGRLAAAARLTRILNVPRMAAYATGVLVNRAVAAMPADTAYVNVGVWNGFTLLAGMAGNGDKTCVGVDNFSQFGGPRAEFSARFEQRRSPAHRFFDVDYEQYFAEHHSGPIGVYYYDGDHGYRNQLRGLEAAERFFVPGTVIFVDDWNQDETAEATREFLAGRAGYELAFEQRTATNAHPTFWNGLGIVRRKS
jgi:hypothetical protein